MPAKIPMSDALLVKTEIDGALERAKFSWATFFTSLTSALFGDPRDFVLEHRLFNTISLLNGIANFGGAFATLSLANYHFLLSLNFVVGILFLCFYYISRFRQTFRSLYWPFVVLILVFLFLNALGNGGSRGAAHYYFIPALVIAIILSDRVVTTVIAVVIFGGATLGLLGLEQMRPDWLTYYSNEHERFVDISGNLLFVQVFTGILVQALTQNLNHERRKSDTLLRNVLPEAIAAELKQTERVQPVEYDASVLFTDFVGFTQIAENYSPQEIISALDDCFSEFDQIARRHGLEKIKTIGDAYMAVGGVPKRNCTHATDCVLAALEIQSFISSMREQKISQNKSFWEIRIGIHSGPLVAGVIGKEKFSYDVWGDTVNTAARLEGSGLPGRINISGATYERVKEFFECEFRGRVAAKHKGEIDMYFVNRKTSKQGSPDQETHPLKNTQSNFCDIENED